MNNLLTNSIKTEWLKGQIKTVLGIVGLVGLCLTIAAPATRAAEVYKIELKETAAQGASSLSGERLKKVRGQSEWAVLTLNEPNVVQLKHMRRLANSYGISKWFENSVTTILACPITTGNCTTMTGNRFEIPKNKTVKDFRFEFQFLADRTQQVRSVQVPSDRLPETQVTSPSRSRSNRR
jgi:hypothetical protein